MTTAAKRRKVATWEAEDQIAFWFLELSADATKTLRGRIAWESLDEILAGLVGINFREWDEPE